ncbi:MAG: hypothetical protein ACRDK7_04340 [Solirubrobacteraceae bacterium]
MAGSVSLRIPFSRFDAARRAGDLKFIREHRAQFTLSAAVEAEVRELIAAREPEALAEWDAGGRPER